MKKNIFFIIAACSFLLTSCGLLEVKSEDKLPGDEFWIDGNAANVEGFLMSAYSNLRKATMGSGAFLTASGDMRCASISPYNNDNEGRRVTYLAGNEMNELNEGEKELRVPVISDKHSVRYVEEMAIVVDEVKEKEKEEERIEKSAQKIPIKRHRITETLLFNK